MLKINSSLNNSQDITEVDTEDTLNSDKNIPSYPDPERLIESTVVIESCHSDISVDTIIQEENDNIYVGTVVKDNCTCSEIHINTVLINNISTVKCCNIVAKNNSDTAIRWSLINLNGETLYTSNSFPYGSTCTINLNSTQIKPGTKLKLKAFTANRSDTSCITLEFTPFSNKSANFIVKGLACNINICYLGAGAN